MKLEHLGGLVSRTRGSMGIRAAANEIGISPTTLSRIERGHIPDMKTLEKVCDWVGEDPGKFAGIGGLEIAFKKDAAIPRKTAKSLATLIELASQQFAKEVDAEGH